MSAADVPLRYRRLRAPREDGAALIEPPHSEGPRLLAHNLALATEWDRASGLPWSRWRRLERAGLVVADPFPSSGSDREAERAQQTEGPFILSGHQPELFHPGVWLKNFLVDRIAKDVGGIGINLMIDSDTVRRASIRVPTGTPESPRVVEVAFDAPTNEQPFEVRPIVDPAAFLSFAQRVHAAYEPLRRPVDRDRRLIVESIWESEFKKPSDLESPWGSSSGEGQVLLGDCLAKGRHALERNRCGLSTHDVPFRQVSGGAVFGEFVDHLLGRWSELHPIYNSALADYRTVNGIRTRAQPAPDLASSGEWLEAPFWIWDMDNLQRRRAFVRQKGAGWELTDRKGITISKESYRQFPDNSLRWPDAPFRTTVRISPRAFITTMYARLVLSDLFIHGIGGAKYDELTDALIRRFFGIEPPAYITATATFKLPIERPNVTEDDLRSLARRIRDIEHHPESFADELAGHRAGELRKLAAQKQELIAAGWQEKQKTSWHARVTACNEHMAALLLPAREQLLQQRHRLLSDLHAAQLLGSREFSFVLFPEETLPPALLDLCAAKA